MFVAHAMCSKPYYVLQKVLEIISQKKPASSDAVFLMGKMVSHAGVEACSRNQGQDPVSGSRSSIRVKEECKLSEILL